MTALHYPVRSFVGSSPQHTQQTEMERQNKETRPGDLPPDAGPPDNGEPHEYHLGEAPTLDKLKEYNWKHEIKLPGFRYIVSEKGRRGCVRVEASKCHNSTMQIRVPGIQFNQHMEKSHDFAAGTLNTTKQTKFVYSTEKWIGKWIGKRMGIGSGQAEMSSEESKEMNLTTGTIRTTKRTGGFGSIGTGMGKGPEMGLRGSREEKTESKVGQTSREPDLEGQPEPSDQQSHILNEMGRKFQTQYVVIGLFSRVNGVPRERLIKVKEPAYLFRYMSWGIIRLRGVGAFFSLKDVEGFALYKVSYQQAISQVFFVLKLHSVIPSAPRTHTLGPTALDPRP
jgi:hypothetical protein